MEVKKRFSPRAGSLFSTFGPSERSPKGGFMLEGLPEAFFGGPRAPQEPPRAPQEPPREPQEPPQRGPRAAKTAPRAPQEPPRRRQEALGAAKRPEEAFRSHFGSLLEPPGIIFGGFWGMFEALLAACWRTSSPLASLFFLFVLFRWCWNFWA